MFHVKHAILGLLFVGAIPASAQGVDMLPLYGPDKVAVEKVSYSTPKKHKAKPKRVHKVAAKKATPKPDDGTRVAAARYEIEGVVRCLAAVRVVGSQDVREGAAEESAKKAWAEMVRWQHGEAYQDFANAKDYAKRCARSSIGETLGQYFSRCEIVATPCRPAMVKGGP